MSPRSSISTSLHCGRMVRVMPSDGFLYLGGAETVLGVSEKFQAVVDHRGIYRPTAPMQPQVKYA